MSNKYCVTCGHGKQYHRKHRYECNIGKCHCKIFNSGVKRDVRGFEVK